MANVAALLERKPEAARAQEQPDFHQLAKIEHDLTEINEEPNRQQAARLGAPIRPSLGQHLRRAD
jgi:hypothetical protein